MQLVDFPSVAGDDDIGGEHRGTNLAPAVHHNDTQIESHAARGESHGSGAVGLEAVGAGTKTIGLKRNGGRDALEQLQKSKARFPRFVLNHVRLAHLYPYMGQYDEAIAEDREVWLLSGLGADATAGREAALRSSVAIKGPRGYWEKALEFSQADVDATEGYGSSYGMAILYTRLGQNDRAIESLELALTQRQLAMTEIAIEPAFEPLQPDVRFVKMLAQVGLK